LATPLFITGIGTGVGKTLVSAILTETLRAHYWKPIQAGYADGTDTQWVGDTISNDHSVIHPELYKLALPASPHIAAREEGIQIDIAAIKTRYELLPLPASDFIIIEGAGGLLVPINEKEFVVNIIQALKARVILVSRNYLGSINHSLLTAEICTYYKLDVIGWIFNDQFMQYEAEIARWSGFPKIASIPKTEKPDKKFVQNQAAALKQKLLSLL
jgi:dethiobiotin synthetase